MKIGLSLTNNIVSTEEAKTYLDLGFTISEEHVIDDKMELSDPEPIEFNSLEELHTFIKDVHNVCLIGITMEGAGYDMWLEIYNDYRE